MLGSFTLPFFITTTSELLLRYFCFEPPLNVRKSLSAHFVYVSFCFEAKVIKFVKNPFYFYMYTLDYYIKFKEEHSTYYIAP